ncbi:TAXI family TRAP transporter solute-binding subunit [Pseudonocardia humida]|uniref:TAXI family TRAP transporter solute-binding subunit n=1 Tax=Pseudonocardia humida TaxID=2800819 RepID=A0ABT1AD39_9PSEU|nr:TAXI family TRAP transporter solute-binding subunit [Pseudonocardia humida]MCO1660843.1 TAXI family TRAP transporter solute-binding subunit [Pseudonocardia humida]
MHSRQLDRRAVLRAGALLGALVALQACSSPFADRRLRLATGAEEGVYYALGTALAQIWRDGLGLTTTPEVRSTAGSVDNLLQLVGGDVDVAISQIDAAADHRDATPADSPRALRALARIYDDVVHLVVPAGSPVRSPADLRGARVAVGAPDSGVSLIARRLLEVSGLRPGDDLSAEQLGLAESPAALVAGRIDALFWVGGLPTRGITELAERMPIRLVDLEGIAADVRVDHSEYTPRTVPVGTYGMTEPVTTLLVRNVLLVTADMPDALAEELVRSMFDAQAQLAEAARAAVTIDPRSAIGTQPVELHPGAVRFYRAEKDG